MIVELMDCDRLPLPGEVPMAFRILPEYIIEDIADFMLFSTK
jgi:ubiquitin conjugation factor E4 B